MTSAADLARQRRELEKQDEAMRSHAMTEQYPQVRSWRLEIIKCLFRLLLITFKAIIDLTRK